MKILILEPLYNTYITLILHLLEPIWYRTLLRGKTPFADVIPFDGGLQFGVGFHLGAAHHSGVGPI